MEPNWHGWRATVLLAPVLAAACAQTPDRTDGPATFPTGIAGAAAETGEASTASTASASPSVLFSYPVVSGVIYSGFGAARGSGRYHSGIDVSTDTGTPVQAAGAGEVIHAGFGYQGSLAWGRTVVIDHGRGWLTLYAHLSAVYVDVGDRLDGGEHIGDVGQSGNATGPHLHVEVRHNGVARNPRDHIPGLGAGS
jgi:murein DD-endopeptidase MepM/ murein hydrolase activator NlpD